MPRVYAGYFGSPQHGARALGIRAAMAAAMFAGANAAGEPMIDLPTDERPAQEQMTATTTAVKKSWSLQLNLDVASAYFYRGIRQEDRGVMVQPAAKLTFNLVDQSDLKVDAFASTWNSFHSRKTGAEDRGGDFIGHWYEADGTGGLTVTRGPLSLTASYVVLTSPSNAFGTVNEIDLTFALDDTEWLGGWALHPYALLAFEVGSNASDGKNSPNGTYLEVGIAPGFTLGEGERPIAISFPVLVGLSLDDYYQNAADQDSTFGYLQIGARASVPLPSLGGWGEWSLNASVSGLFLGTHTREYNGGEKAQAVGTVGVQVNF